MLNVFIVSSKGIPAKYGGFETFVENLTKRKKDSNIKYFVSCMGENDDYIYNGAFCFSIPLKKDNSIHRLLNVSKALYWVENYIKSHINNGEKNLVYILGCRVGLLIKKHKNTLKQLGCDIVCNPDGVEWQRNKWNSLQKRILLLSEKKLLKSSKHIICDSINIQKILLSKYKFIEEKSTSFIAYGSDVTPSLSTETQLDEWLLSKGTKKNDYFLIIGRFVPENNYEIMIREFIKSGTTKKLLIISNYEKNAFYRDLENKLHFSSDNRIIFAGTLYDEQLLKKVRENAFAYLHGHSVGGTNPSLLEALASTKINLLYDVSFNKEVGRDQCLYFNGEKNNLSSLINDVENNYAKYANSFKPQEIIKSDYSWDSIVEKHEKLFLDLTK